MTAWRPTRRTVLGLIGGVGTAAGIGAATPWLASSAEVGRLVRSEMPLPAPFTVPLPIPAVLSPTSDADGDHYDITQQVAAVELIPGVRTTIWGYNGTFPGPTIVSRSGRTTTVRHRNMLPVPTVVHLHGGHTPAASDGYPTDLLLPRDAAAVPHDAMRRTDPEAAITVGERRYTYPMRQRAATLWYHDHRMDATGASVWRGLAGFHLVHDDEEAVLPLPAGDRDIPIMIADRAFAADGSMPYPAADATRADGTGVRPGYSQGVLGDVILVNGAPWPVLDVEAARYRLRLLNASNSRRYRLELDPPPPGGRGLVQIGSDGGLLARPLRHDAIDVAPAERFDVVVDFSGYRDGQAVTLRNRLGSGSTGHVMRFQVTRRARDDSRVPERLSTVVPLVSGAGAAVRTRRLVFHSTQDGGWTINGRPFDPTRADATPRLDRTEVWQVTGDFHHSVHLHLVQFQVLRRNDGPPGRYDAGWKDTIDLRPAEQVALAVRFTDYTGRFLYHCHNLEHEDMGMMATVRVES